MAVTIEQARNAARHEAEVAALEREAAKRFWRIVPEDPTRGRFYVEDAVGRRMCDAKFPAEIRGFFAGLTPQA
jgi:hypothetical protein